MRKQFRKMTTSGRSYQPHVLAVGANHRKTGKSRLIEDIIHHFRSQEPVAMKIAAYNDESILNLHHPGSGKYLAIKETEAADRKDSKRFLEAGAAESFFIAGLENELEKQLPDLLNKYSNRPLIIESNWFSTRFKPGFLLLIEDKDVRKPKQGFEDLKKLAQAVVPPNNITHLVLMHWHFREGKWEILRQE